MEQRAQQLLKRLAVLGYHSYEISRILQEANSSHGMIETLEKYEQLGSNFNRIYSK